MSLLKALISVLLITISSKCLQGKLIIIITIHGYLYTTLEQSPQPNSIILFHSSTTSVWWHCIFGRSKYELHSAMSNWCQWLTIPSTHSFVAGFYNRRQLPSSERLGWLAKWVPNRDLSDPLSHLLQLYQPLPLPLHAQYWWKFIHLWPAPGQVLPSTLPLWCGVSWWKQAEQKRTCV